MELSSSKDNLKNVNSKLIKEPGPSINSIKISTKLEQKWINKFWRSRKNPRRIKKILLINFVQLKNRIKNFLINSNSEKNNKKGEKGSLSKKKQNLKNRTSDSKI